MARLRFALTTAVFLVIQGLLVVIPSAEAEREPKGSGAKNDRARVSSDLKQIRVKLDRENRRLDELRKEERTLRSSHDELTKQFRQFETEEKQIRAVVESLASEIQVREIQTDQAKQDLARETQRFRERLAALYKVQHRNTQLMYLAEAHSLGDLLRRSRYASAVAESDRMRVSSLDSMQQTLQVEQQLLAVRRLEREAALAKVVELGKEVVVKREENARLVKEVARKQELQQKSLVKLEESALELERVLASIMGSEEPSPVQPPSVAKKETPRTGDQIATPFQGAGLAKLVGRLSSPVDGKVLQRFGKQKHEEFSDILFVKGLEFSSSVGARVTPVARGKVILSQYLPGFGNVVIVDHGSRYYTLYGRLASTLVQTGDLVETDKVVGILGEPDFRGRNFYFELRLKGKAIDPKDYFAPDALKS